MAIQRTGARVMNISLVIEMLEDAKEIHGDIGVWIDGGWDDEEPELQYDLNTGRLYIR